MKIIYETVDGRQFDYEEDARKHESEIETALTMWSYKGIKTDSTSNVIVVKFNTELAGKLFIAKCREEHSVEHGIDPECPGIYAWDDLNEEYFYLNDNVVETLQSIMCKTIINVDGGRRILCE